MTVGSVHNQKSGIVFIQDFDRGVVETLGAIPNSKGDMYVISNMDGVSPPPDYEGIPVYFAWPDDIIDTQILPSIVVRRDSFLPALQRWHLGAFDYNVPAPGAKPVTVVHPLTGEVIREGWDKYERKDQAVPFDIVYTIQIRARFRNNLRVESLKMLRYVMTKYQPYTRVSIKDSINDTRFYDAFMESPSAMDVMPDLAGRESNFNITLRVEGELDLNDPVVVRTLSHLLTINTTTI